MYLGTVNTSPELEVSSTVTGCKRACTHLVKPWSLARWRAVLPCLSLLSGDAPATSRARTMWCCWVKTARCNGVWKQRWNSRCETKTVALSFALLKKLLTDLESYIGDHYMVCLIVCCPIWAFEFAITQQSCGKNQLLFNELLEQNEYSPGGNCWEYPETGGLVPFLLNCTLPRWSPGWW